MDGDTPELLLDLGWRIQLTARARIAGINAPELDTDAGPPARLAAMELVPPGTTVTFTSHSLDKYGRPLGSIRLPDGRDFAQAMIDGGHAVPYGR